MDRNSFVELYEKFPKELQTVNEKDARKLFGEVPTFMRTCNEAVNNLKR